MDALYVFFKMFFVLQLIKSKIIAMILSLHERFKNHNYAFFGQ